MKQKKTSKHMFVLELQAEVTKKEAKRLKQFLKDQAILLRLVCPAGEVSAYVHDYEHGHQAVVGE